MKGHSSAECGFGDLVRRREWSHCAAWTAEGAGSEAVGNPGLGEERRQTS